MFHFSGCRVHKPMYSAYDDKVLTLSGYPIRIPPGLSSLAALRGFSQLVASFFACWHQGIHHKPLGSSFTWGHPPVIHFNLKIIANLCFVCLILVCLYSWKLFIFPQNCWSINHFWSISVILPRGCQSARLSDCFTYVREGVDTAGRTWTYDPALIKRVL